MDFQLNTSLNASISSRQISSRNGEGSSVRPRTDNSTGNQSNQPGQVNHTPQTNRVSFVSSLVTTANTLDAQKAGNDRPSVINKLNVDRNSEQRSKADVQETEQLIIDDAASANVQAQEAELNNQARQYIHEVKSQQSRESDIAEDASVAISETDARHAADAYQAAGAVFGIGFTEGTDNDPVVFNPETISPIDIQA